MATSSIYNEIKIKDKEFCRKLVNAMENCSNNKGKDVKFSKTVSELNADQLREIFGK